MSSIAIGHHFKHAHQIPWIADIRDSFKRRFFRPGPDVSIKRRVRYRRALFAVRSLNIADARVYVTEGEALADAGLFAPTPHVIESGFDMEAWQRLHADPRPRSIETLQVLYAGRVYPGNTAFDIFFEGVRRFRDCQRDSPVVGVTHLGSNSQPFIRSAERNGVADLVTLGGAVALERSRRAMIEADVLLLVTASGASGIPGGKLYEYGAAGRPILAVPGDDDFVSGLLRETGIGVCASTPAEVAAVLERVRSGVLTGGTWGERSQRLADFSWSRRAWHLSQLVGQIQEMQHDAQPA
jgi:glycosyltransferase involved in cell wall biosynthesis